MRRALLGFLEQLCRLWRAGRGADSRKDSAQSGQSIWRDQDDMECHVPETHVIPLVLDAAAGRRDAFTVFGTDYPTPDGTCIRDYIHVSDLADAHVLALRILLQGGDSEAINVGTGRGWSVLELVEIARKITRRDIPILLGPRRPGDPPALVSDPQRARERLEWLPRYPDIAEHISHAWAWRQSGGAVPKPVGAHTN